MIKIPKIYVQLGVPDNFRVPYRRTVLHAFWNMFLCLGNLIFSTVVNGPGINFHFASALRAIRLIGTGFSLSRIYTLLVMPMDSVRYFEFDFFWKSIRKQASLGNYLDVSSPRLFSWRVLVSKKARRVVLVNPDHKDLSLTSELLKADGLEKYCELCSALVSELDEPPQSFDTVVCISVLEHIPQEAALDALQRIWGLIKPGGRLLLSVPCARQGFDEYIDFNEYGLLQSSDDGFVFGQRFYDQQLLDAYIHAIVGQPFRMEIFGEKVSGTFFNNRKEKLFNPNYPSWQEAWMMATQYRYFKSLDELPGVGVIAFEFIKS